MGYVHAMERLLLVLLAAGAAVAERRFIHPGIGTTLPQLRIMKEMISNGTEPWKTWYNNNVVSYKTYKQRGPYAEVGRNPDVNRYPFLYDMLAVGKLARIWYIENDTASAEKAMKILVDWATNHTTWSGVEPAFLLFDSIDGVVGADILRGTYPGWTQNHTTLLEKYIGEFWMTLIFVGQGHCSDPDIVGAGSHVWPANQGSIMIMVAMGCSIFSENELLFNESINAFLTDFNAGLPDTLPSGQIGDTGRDNGHAGAEALQLISIAEYAWCQGINLFSGGNNRLSAVAEYLAKRQLHGLGVINDEVPFTFFGCSYALWFSLPDYDGVIRSADSIYTAAAFYKSQGISMPYSDLFVQYTNYSIVRTIENSTANVAKPVWTEPAVSPANASSSLTIALLGTLKSTGSGSFIDGRWNLKSGGVDGGSESNKGLVFAYKEVTGDCTLVALVESGTGEALIMDRVQATTAAKQHRLFASDGYLAAFYRNGCEPKAAARRTFSDSNITLPYWVKMVRRGNFVASFSSPDGTNWSPSMNIAFDSLPDKIYAGVAVFSGNATFSNVSVGNVSNSRPNTPNLVSAVACSASSVAISWSTVDSAIYYTVYRTENVSVSFTTIATKVTGTAVFDTELDEGRTYWYKVTASGYSGRSLQSNVVNVTTTNASQLPEQCSFQSSTAPVAYSESSNQGSSEFPVIEVINSESSISSGEPAVESKKESLLITSSNEGDSEQTEIKVSSESSEQTDSKVSSESSAQTEIKGSSESSAQTEIKVASEISEQTQSTVSSEPTVPVSNAHRRGYLPLVGFGLLAMLLC